MKKLLTLMVAVMAATIAAQAANVEIVVAPNYIFPKQEGWDKAYGIEGQIRLWANDYAGIGGAGGIQKWDLKDEGGNAKMIPVGGSLFIRPLPADSKIVKITLEGGARYVFVDSDLTDTTVKIGNGVIGLVAGELGICPIDKFQIFGGGGYQFDISKGKLSIDDVDYADNELKGWFVRAGVALTF